MRVCIESNNVEPLRALMAMLTFGTQLEVILKDAHKITLKEAEQYTKDLKITQEGF